MTDDGFKLFKEGSLMTSAAGTQRAGPKKDPWYGPTMFTNNPDEISGFTFALFGCIVFALVLLCSIKVAGGNLKLRDRKNANVAAQVRENRVCLDNIESKYKLCMETVNDRPSCWAFSHLKQQRCE